MPKPVTLHYETDRMAFMRQYLANKYSMTDAQFNAAKKLMSRLDEAAAAYRSHS